MLILHTLLYSRCYYRPKYIHSSTIQYEQICHELVSSAGSSEWVDTGTQVLSHINACILRHCSPWDMSVQLQIWKRTAILWNISQCHKMQENCKVSVSWPTKPILHLAHTQNPYCPEQNDASFWFPVCCQFSCISYIFKKYLYCNVQLTRYFYLFGTYLNLLIHTVCALTNSL